MTCLACSGVTMAPRLPKLRDLPMATDRVERRAELADLRPRQLVEEVTPHTVDVDGRGGLEDGESRVGEHREGDPPIVGTGFADDETLADESIESAGQPARRQMEAHGEVAHPESPVG